MYSNADTLESRIDVAKRSEMGSAFHQGAWFADAHALRFEADYRSNLCNAFL